MLIFLIIFSYLYGSIPFCFLIGKMNGIDIRTIGSGNVGGSNLGRACGKKAFVYGFILDMSKGFMVVILGNIFNVDPLILLPFVLIGHSFSIFLKFKGGKGIASSFGFALGYSLFPALFAITIFLIILKIYKYVSLASIISIFAYLILSFFLEPLYYSLCILVLFIIIVYLHRDNIKRIKNGTENKINWM